MYLTRHAVDINQEYDGPCKRTFRRDVNHFVDCAVECFLVNNVPKVLITDDVEGEDVD